MSGWPLNLALSAAPALLLAGLRWAAGADFDGPALLLHWAFVWAVLVAARFAAPYPQDGRWVWPWPAGGLVLAGGAATFVYALTQRLEPAWVLLATLYALLIGLAGPLGAVFRPGPLRWAAIMVLAAAAGALPVAVNQIELRFADEEFFAALQALALGAFWIALLAAYRGVWGREGDAAPGAEVPGGVGLRSLAAGLRVRRPGLAPGAPAVGLALLGLLAVLGVVTARAYQRSFYPLDAPGYPGVTSENPFVCGQIASEEPAYDGRDVHARLLRRVEANPHKAAPEYGLLAVGRDDPAQARVFRDHLLAEAAQNLYAGPANSVKFIQYLAALRVYYYARVRAVFPDVFSAEDEARVADWLRAVNRRTLTVEWVDWAYALALGQWPIGPYENQDNGAGLLALLEGEQLSAPELSPVNLAYLHGTARGWARRFRNTDDAFIYQPEWIQNAYFQSLYLGRWDEGNARRSFDWMLLQAPPDGAALGYNHPFAAPLAGAAYLGARLTGDERYLWLAGRSVAELEARGAYLSAQPGAEEAAEGKGHPPDAGSCLLYGDSGLPTQTGPLAPDKIVLRDGWAPDDMYVLLNLRFTGWHRYKATNTVTQVYQQGPLVVEALAQQPIAWLPAGRSLLRDKRIPRQNLNGLLVERAGLDAVLYSLTGLGGPWAQDPPYYARVERFETGADMDAARAAIDGWHGWRHIRTTYLAHDGPLVFVDEAYGPARGRAALAWHTAGEGGFAGGRAQLRSGTRPAEMLVLSPDAEPPLIQPQPWADADTTGQAFVIAPPARGRLRLVTVILTGAWHGAEASLRQAGGELVLVIAKGERRLTLPLAFDAGAAGD